MTSVPEDIKGELICVSAYVSCISNSSAISFQDAKKIVLCTRDTWSATCKDAYVFHLNKNRKEKCTLEQVTTKWCVKKGARTRGREKASRRNVVIFRWKSRLTKKELWFFKNGWWNVDNNFGKWKLNTKTPSAPCRGWTNDYISRAIFTQILAKFGTIWSRRRGLRL